MDAQSVHLKIARLFWNDRSIKDWLYVNSWGRDKRQIIIIRVGVLTPARILCMAEENPVPEIAEVAHPVADPLQDFCFVVAAFRKTV